MTPPSMTADEMAAAVRLANELIAVNEHAYVMPGSLSLATALLATHAELARVRAVYDAAIAWESAGHVDDANHWAGDCDDCPARLALMELRAAIDAATTAMRGEGES